MGDAVVLCYHALSERWTADLSVRPHAFEEQLRDLQRRGFFGVTFSEVVSRPARGRRVAVTFDDAFTTVRTLAKPILDELGWPATVFAVTRFAADGSSVCWPGVEHWARTEHAHELASLAWPDLRTLAEAGWEIGSHTVTHPKLTRIDDAALAGELSDSREAVETALGQPCPSIAYPYGDVDARVVTAARVAGYRAAGALPTRWPLRDLPLQYPRVGVYHPDDLRRFRVKTARLTRDARRLLRR